MREIIFIICLSFTLAGCQSIPTYVKPAALGAKNMPGIYHRVEAGQTLWKISRIYNVNMEDIIRANQLSESVKIEVGQMVFVPNQTSRPQNFAVSYPGDDFIWPLRGKVIAGFGTLYHNLMNKGIDISPNSSYEVAASRSGKVVFYSTGLGNFGKTLIIDHGDGLRTVYSRNSEVYVKPGDLVQRGAIIARAGSAGRDKNSYLHFEVRKGATPQNPLFYLP